MSKIHPCTFVFSATPKTQPLCQGKMGGARLGADAVAEADGAQQLTQPQHKVEQCSRWCKGSRDECRWLNLWMFPVPPVLAVS